MVSLLILRRQEEPSYKRPDFLHRNIVPKGASGTVAPVWEQRETRMKCDKVADFATNARCIGCPCGNADAAMHGSPATRSIGDSAADRCSYRGRSIDCRDVRGSISNIRGCGRTGGKRPPAPPGPGRA